MSPKNTPEPAAAPQRDAVVRVDLGRGSRLALFVSVPLLLLLVAGFVSVATSAADAATATIGWAFAALCGLPLLVMGLSLKRLLVHRLMEFDARGLHYSEGTARVSLEWTELAAVGIGYEDPPDVPTIRPGVRLANALLDAARVERRRYIAVEVFPRDPAATSAHPLLTRFRKDQAPPRADLPRERWRFPLPPAPGLTAAVVRGMETLRPLQWLGWFQRRWRGAD